MQQSHIFKLYSAPQLHSRSTYIRGDYTRFYQTAPFIPFRIHSAQTALNTNKILFY